VCFLALVALFGLGKWIYSILPITHYYSPTFSTVTGTYRFPPFALHEKTIKYQKSLTFLIPSKDAQSYKFPHQQEMFNSKSYLSIPLIEYRLKYIKDLWDAYQLIPTPKLSIYQNTVSPPPGFKEKTGMIVVSIPSSSEVPAKAFKEIFHIDFSIDKNRPKNQPILYLTSYVQFQNCGNAFYRETETYAEKLQSASFKCNDLSTKPASPFTQVSGNSIIDCYKHDPTQIERWTEICFKGSCILTWGIGNRRLGDR
jgi:hypothetical protein